MKKLDLHMHPLCHEYYDGWQIPHSIKTLTSQDEERIREIIHWNIQRGMDIISVTDHDMVLPSLYAMKYVEKERLPIIVIPGIEMELHYRGERAHFCAWGIQEQPMYHRSTSIQELTDRIHDMGGIICINHPYFSPGAFFDACGIVDGYEYWNGGQREHDGFFVNGEFIMQEKGVSLKPYYNSDFHHDPGLCSLKQRGIPKRWNEWDDESTQRWLEQFK